MLKFAAIQARAVKEGRDLAKDIRCVMLQGDGTCRCYAERPFICRLWGATKAMACPFGCVPEKWMTDAEAEKLRRKILRLSIEQMPEEITNESVFG